MYNENIPKSILLQAEWNYGLDVLEEVLDSVKRRGVEESIEHFEYEEQPDHVRCIEFLYGEENTIY